MLLDNSVALAQSGSVRERRLTAAVTVTPQLQGDTRMRHAITKLVRRVAIDAAQKICNTGA